MSIHMEATKIDASKTIGEIMGLLAKSGARQIVTEYDRDGEPCGLTFAVPIAEKSFFYKIPIRIDTIFNYLQDKRVNCVEESREKDLVQAKKIGWRQILRWLQAQFALMELGMVNITEVFLPYCWDGKQTLYELFAEKEGIKLLEEPK